MKGGHARSGPAPDPTALRRERDAGDWTTLPVEGRKGETPAWPLLGLSDREAELWEGLWSKPQAVMWESQEQQLEVALFVRNLTLVELPNSPINAGTLLRQQMDSLGLTTPGLRQHRWRIGRGVQAAAATPAKRAPVASGRSARTRFAVIDGDAG
jgi:hypothetical protein